MGTAVITSQTTSDTSSDHLVKTTAKELVNGDTIFNVYGDIQILSLVSECYTPNDPTPATTLQYSVLTSRGSTQTISGATTSLASKVAGSTITLSATSVLTESPTLSDNGVSINTASRGVRVPTGSIKLVIGGGSSVGKYKHYIRYEPLEYGAYITPAF